MDPEASASYRQRAQLAAGQPLDLVRFGASDFLGDKPQFVDLYLQVRG